MELNYHYDDLSPVKGAPFKVFFEDGSYREGTLDDKGYAKLENVPKGKSEIYYGEDPSEFKKDIPDDLDAEIEDTDTIDDVIWSLFDEEAYQKLTNDLQNGAKQWAQLLSINVL